MPAIEDCDIVLHPIYFRMLNADNKGDYFDGIAPDCVAEDDLDMPLGDEAESSVAEALHVMQSGTCSLHAADLASKPAPARRRHVPDGTPSAEAIVGPGPLF
jgi:hypothetical protein